MQFAPPAEATAAVATPAPPQPRPTHSQTYEWTDSEPTGATGWVVIDRVINSVSGGGIFMSATATVGEVAAIAANMSRKFTVTSPQIGGAKAGIRFDHRDPRAKEVLRRFILANAVLLRNSWVTAGDLNTDDSFIEHVIRSELGLPTSQGTFGRLFAETTGQQDLSTNLARIIAMPACPEKFFPLIEGAVGYGLAAAIHTSLHLMQFRPTGGMPRVAIQGFGAVGSSLAYYLQKMHAALVVAISDVDGYIVNPDGLDVVGLLKIRQRVLGDATQTESQRAHAAKNITQYLTPADCNGPAGKLHKKSDTQHPEDYLVEFLSQADQVDVFCPCASRYQITDTVANMLLGRWTHPLYNRTATSVILIASGANNPFGVRNGDGGLDEDLVGAVLQRVTDAGVCVVPDWVANSGTAQLFHRGLSVPFNLEAADAAENILEACAEPIREYIRLAWENECGNSDGRTKLATACENLARERLAAPITFAAATSRATRRRKIQPPAAIPLDQRNPAQSHYWLAPQAAPSMDACARREFLQSFITDQMAECIPSTDALLQLFDRYAAPVFYDGFEPSGRMHIAQGLLKARFVNAITLSGGTFIFWVADWFAKLNHKMDGDMARIQDVGRYMIEVWKSCGMDMERVKFLWASEEFDKRCPEYLARVLDIATKTTQNRVVRCTQIMGRKESDTLHASQIFYPCMQAADIFFLGVDVCQLGMDQRKVNMLAREYADQAGLPSPIILSHPMLPGLKRGQEKMSKSQPDTAIFMDDSPDEVERKIRGAFCPEADEYNAVLAKFRIENPAATAEQLATHATQANPILAYFHALVPFGEKTPVRVGDEGHVRAFISFDDLYAAYCNTGQIHPIMLKAALTRELNTLLEPVRQHFATDPLAAHYREVALSL